MKQLSKLLVAALAVLPLLGLGGLAQQNIIINVPQSLFLDCSAAAAITFSVTQTQIEAAQPFNIGTWGCNVDALTKYRLNATLATTTTNITNADPTDFSQTCTSATGGNPGANAPACDATNTSLSGADPTTRRGTGGNTASTPGADFSGNVRLNVSDWDVGTLPGSYTGTITYTVTDTTP